MSESQSRLDPEVESEIEDLIDSRVEAAIDRADFATQDGLEGIREDVSGEIDGLRTDLEAVAGRIPTEDELADLAKEWSLGTVRHIVGDECETDSHKRVRDRLKGFIKDTVQPDQNAAESDESDEDGAGEDLEAPDGDGSEWGGGDIYPDARSSPWGPD